MGIGGDAKSYAISGFWDPSDPNFQILNTETPKGIENNFFFIIEFYDVNILLELLHERYKLC